MKVQSSSVEIKDHYMYNNYEYQSTQIKEEGGKYLAFPTKTMIQFKTNVQTPKVGLMLVGWGGNNGTTVTGGIIANKFKVQFNSRKGP
jgi:myo-inositol-1-phosphate synthase